MKGNVYGYVRVSTKEQNEGGQEAFREHEYAKIPRHTARIYAISINSVHREACCCERSEQ